MVFYRKYRPQTIDDLDSTAVRESLTAVLKKDIPHAFLFTGPKGLGKTSTARIVAKVVNCTKLRVDPSADGGELRNKKEKKENSQLSTLNSQLVEPCNSCDQCLAITNGTSLDVLEIDAASNRGIDEIRELKEKIRLAPVSAKKKVYIIDEVHMLTTEAFNALLKTLEEPPAHAMFMLCTTEPHKVPNTILSRCFHILFRLATSEELVRSFKRIVAGEKADIDDEALLMIANLSEGGFRDGAKLLEELITTAGETKITKEFIEEKYHVSSTHALVVGMLASLREKDAKKGLEIIKQITEQGIDIKYFLQQIMQSLHNALLVQVGVMKSEVRSEKLEINDGEIRKLFELLNKAYGEIKYAVLPQLPLELAVLEWCEMELRVEPFDSAQGKSGEVRNKINKKENSQSSTLHSQFVDEGVTVASMRKQLGTIKKNKALYGDKAEKKIVSKDGKMEVEIASVELLQTTGNGEVTQEWLSHFWECLIYEMKKHNHTVAGVLRGCKISKYAEGTLTIQTSYKFHKERLEDMRNHDVLAQMTKLLTGKDIEIEIELRKS